MGVMPSLLPQVGMEFSNIDEAWMFWISYGGQKGFEVRKRCTNKRKSDGKVRSCRYVCANEGHRKEDKRDHPIKCPRAETRTNTECRSFGVFVGLNQFRETVVFGVALLYGETFESFKWLFETFLKAHNDDMHDELNFSLILQGAITDDLNVEF
jgi:hypothetical protein